MNDDDEKLKKNLDPSSHRNIRKDFDKDNLIIL